MKIPMPLFTISRIGIIIQFLVFIIPGSVSVSHADSYDKTCLSQCRQKYSRIQSQYEQLLSRCEVDNRRGLFHVEPDGTRYMNGCLYYPKKISDNKADWHKCADKCKDR